MTISLGFRPRSTRTRLRMAELLRDAPPVVALGFDDDGWTAACLRIGGRTPVWASAGDPAPCADALAQLGLPGLGEGPAVATLRGDLSWAPRWSRALAHVPPPIPLPKGPLVTILLCTRDRADVLPRTLAAAQAQSWPCEVLVVDDGSTDATPILLGQRPGVRFVRRARSQGKAAALAAGIAAARGTAVLVLDEGDQLLPGAVRVLATALFADSTLAAVWGDTVACDPLTGAPTALDAACRLPSALVGLVAQHRAPARPGATLARTSVWRSMFPSPSTDLVHLDRDLPRALAALGPVATVPLPVLLHHGPPLHAGHSPSLVAPATPRSRRAGALLVVDDGDDGALETTLALHASGQTLFVSLEVPRDPLDDVTHFWPGTYASQTRLNAWAGHGGPLRLALTSAPGWAPPPVDEPGWRPDLRAPEAVLAVAAALGWAPPLRSRPGLPQVHGPISRCAWQVRRALDGGRPREALVPLGVLLTTLPGWRGAWRLAAETYAALGQSAEASACRARAGVAMDRNAYSC
jgi:hypothetical protein